MLQITNYAKAYQGKTILQFNSLQLPKGMYSPSGSQLMEILYIPYVPCKAENMILRNRKIKYDQMEYLLSRVKNKDSRIFKYAEDYKKSGNRSTWKELR